MNYALIHTLVFAVSRGQSAERSVVRTTFESRTGISLLEVLISIGVLAVGLLGVAALIPAAGFQAKEGARNERLANIGKRLFREIEIRGFLTVNANGSSRNLANKTSPGTPPSPFIINGQAYCIDPMALATNLDPNGNNVWALQDGNFTGGSIDRQYFPNLRNPPAALLGITPRIPRLALISDPNSTSLTTMVRAASDELLYSSDEMTFEIPSKKSLLPIQRFSQSGSTNIKRNTESKLSWFATCKTDYGLGSGASVIPDYQVSLAIYESRAKYDPELFGQIHVARSTLWSSGGRSVDIEFPFNTNNGTTNLDNFAKSIRKNTWIAMGWQPAGVADAARYSWYRIVDMSGAVGSAAYQARLTLQGSDWPYGTPAAGAGGFSTEAFGIYVPKVVAVYTKTIPLKSSSAWE